MKENNNNRKSDAGEKKEPTLQQLQKRKKMIIFPLLFLLFAGSMWLIFAPSGSKDEQQTDGFNPELPMPKDEGIIGDKRDAYELEAMRRREQEKMKTLQDFSFMLDEQQQSEEEYERQVRMAPVPPDYQDDLNSGRSIRSSSGSSHSHAFQNSASAYQNINRQLGNWYDEPATEVGEQSELELQWRVQELERKLEEEEQKKLTADQQMELIEKSYQLAAKYMPGSVQSDENASQTSAIPSNNMGQKTVAQPVSKERHNVVSLLAAPVPDSVFMEDYTKERNRGFVTVAGNEKIKDKNSIRACIYKTVTIVDGQEVQMQLLEPMKAGDYIVPKNTIISGAARIGGERLGITVNFIQHEGNVIPIEMVAFDMDGNQGISVPGSEEINAVKEVAANMGSQMGSSITITDDAGSQLLADLGRSAIQGTSQYISKKMRTVKITLKVGYQVLLLPPMQ